MKIIPAIDMRGGRCVRLFQGNYSKETVYGDPVEQAIKWQESGAELIHLVDLDGAKAGHIVNGESIEKICRAVSIPCELGGGIRSVQDAKYALNLGVSRVILGTAACENPASVESFITQIGADRIVVGIDAKDGKVAIRGWIDTSTTEALALARELCSREVKRIIYTDIATDGSLKGPNFSAMREMCETVPNCNIIASGGISSQADIEKFVNFSISNLEGVIVGKALYDNRVTLPDLLQITRRNGK